MIRIGVVNIDVSHPKAFSKILNEGNRGRYVAVYNDGFRGDDEVEAFVKNAGLKKRCHTIEELVECVDIGFVQGCNWDKHVGYAKKFIKAGKPVFIDKPIVGNMKDCEKLKKAVENGAVILGSSSARYAKEIQDFVNKPVSKRGEILNVFGTAGVDEFNYGIHIVEAIGGLIGKGAVSTTFNCVSEKDGCRCETFSVKYDSGKTAIYNTFSGLWMPFSITVMTTKGTYSFTIDSSKIYAELLDNICTYMETGESKAADIDALLESVKIMLAGKISRENQGKEILLRDIPLDYAGYDGYEFEKEYAKKAKKIYL